MRTCLIAFGVTAAFLLVGCGHKADNAGTFPMSSQPSTPGATSRTAPMGTPATSISSLHMTKAGTGWAVVGGRIVRISDGGATWVDVTPRKLETLSKGSPPPTIFFLDTDHAWAVVGGKAGFTVYRTNDAGAAWSSVAVTTPVHWAFSLAFVDPSHGDLLAQQPEGGGNKAVAIYRTTDGGASWSNVSETGAAGSTAGALPYVGWSPGDISFASASVGWAEDAYALPQGESGPFMGGTLLFRTTDGGITWRKSSLPVPSVADSLVAMYAPTFFSAQVGVAPVVMMVTSEPASKGQFMTFDHTVDAGTTWSTEPKVLCQQVFDWLDAQHGWIISNSRLMATADGGKSWTEVHTGTPLTQVRQLDFVSTRTGWAVEADQSGWNVLKTINGGQNWISRTPTITP